MHQGPHVRAGWPSEEACGENLTPGQEWTRLR